MIVPFCGRVSLETSLHVGVNAHGARVRWDDPDLVGRHAASVQKKNQHACFTCGSCLKFADVLLLWVEGGKAVGLHST